MRFYSFRHGFNLVEAAIVLGVVGLVIGGIWIAAAQVRENMVVNKLAEGVLITSNNIQRLVNTYTANTLGLADITTPMIAAGVFPQDWITDTGALLTQVNGSVIINSVPDSSPPARFHISLTNVPKSTCMKLIAAVSSRYVSTSMNDNKAGGLILVYVAQTSYSTSVFPIMPTGSECTTSNTVRFSFPYKTF